jgi:protoheme IX farnesyltransferase
MMPEDSTSTRIARRTLWPLAALAALAYGGALAGDAQPSLAGVTLSWLALVLLGGAVAMLTARSAGPAARQRLGARAQAARRRYLYLAFGTSALVFAVVALGVLVTSSGALWSCTVPICLSADQAVMLTSIHRGMAAASTALVGWLALRTWRAWPEGVLRSAAAWALGLILAQDLIGLAQVMLAAGGASLPLEGTRLAHLAIGALTWSALVALSTLALRLPFPSGTQAAHATVGAPGLTDTALLASRPSVLKDYVSLTKPGVISLLIFTTITAMYITPAGMPDWRLVAWTTLGGWLMASGAHALNCYFDRDVDVNMGRTSRRPIPSGRIPAWHALVLGSVLGGMAFGMLALFVNLLAAALSLAGLLYYVLIYTLWLKRSSWNNIVIGGGAGAFPPLVGWAAVTGELSWAVLILWLIIFYWTPPHFWALALIRQKDYARAGIPMLPVVAGDAETRRQILLYSIQMVVLTLLPTLIGMLGLPYLLMAIALGAVFLRYAIRMLADHAAATTWGLYKYSLLYLALLFGAMVVDRLVFAP